MKWLRDELSKPIGAVFLNERQDLCWHVFLALHYCGFSEHKWHPVFHEATPKGEKCMHYINILANCYQKYVLDLDSQYQLYKYFILSFIL